MRGAFSLPPLRALLRSRHTVCAVVLPAAAALPADAALRRIDPAPPPGLLPILDPFVEQTIVGLAWEQQIPVLEIRRLAAPETLATLAALAPDVGVAACFARRIPPALLGVPQHGLLNVHPALLPAYRGPAPLFWTLRDGAPGGVTVHAMDAALDTGPIVAQAAVALPDGADGAALDTLLAARGGELLTSALEQLAAGTLERTAQPAAGSAAPWPMDVDFTVEPDWSARRAFNFMRGAAEWNVPFRITLGDQRFSITHALAFDAQATLDAPFSVAGRTLRAQCAPGVLEAVLGDQ